MLAIDSSPQISDSVFHIAQTVLAFAVFLGAVAASRWGIRIFISDRRRTSHPSLRFYSSVFVVAIVSLLLLRGLVRKASNLYRICHQRFALQSGIGLASYHFSRFLLWVDSHGCLLVGHIGGRFCARVRGQTDRSMAAPASRRHNVRRNQSPVSCHQNNSDGQPIVP